MGHLLLNCDWLGLSVTFPSTDGSFDDIPNHVWRLYDGTNVWRKRRILLNDQGEKVATILYSPKSSIIDQRSGLIEIANEWLYHGISPSRILDMLSTSRPFVVSGINRLDLAVDFNPTDEQRAVIFGLGKKDMRIAGKANETDWWSVSRSSLLADWVQGIRIPHQQSWGHKTSDVKWKLYYKTKDLLDAEGGVCYSKPYIVDCWREAEMDIRDVWRLEVSLHRCNQFLYGGEQLSWPVFKSCNPRILYAGLYNNRFKVRKEEGHKDKTNDTAVSFLPINDGARLQSRRPASTGSRSGRIALMRHLIQSLEGDEVLLQDDTREEVLWMVQNIVERDGLQHYFNAIVEKSVYEWVEDVRIEACRRLEEGCNAERVRRHYDSEGITLNDGFESAGIQRDTQPIATQQYAVPLYLTRQAIADKKAIKAALSANQYSLPIDGGEVVSPQ